MDCIRSQEAIFRNPKGILLQLLRFKHKIYCCAEGVNTSNTIEEEIKETIILQNKTYYTDFLFKSKLMSNQTKQKLY